MFFVPDNGQTALILSSGKGKIHPAYVFRLPLFPYSLRFFTAFRFFPFLCLQHLHAQTQVFTENPVFIPIGIGLPALFPHVDRLHLGIDPKRSEPADDCGTVGIGQSFLPGIQYGFDPGRCRQDFQHPGIPIGSGTSPVGKSVSVPICHEKTDRRGFSKHTDNFFRQLHPRIQHRIGNLCRNQDAVAVKPAKSRRLIHKLIRPGIKLNVLHETVQQLFTVSFLFPSQKFPVAGDSKSHTIIIGGIPLQCQMVFTIHKGSPVQGDFQSFPQFLRYDFPADSLLFHPPEPFYGIENSPCLHRQFRTHGDDPTQGMDALFFFLFLQ